MATKAELEMMCPPGQNTCKIDDKNSKADKYLTKCKGNGYQDIKYQYDLTSCEH